MIKIRTVGGYSEVGKNMTAVRLGDDVVILDMGVHLENYISLTEDDEYQLVSRAQMIAAKAIPDDSYISEWRKDVVAIIPSHAHLDHIGAIPYMAAKYDAPIICTPYTKAVIEAIMKDKKKSIPNKIVALDNDSKLKLSDNLTIEFVNMTHSIPHTATVVLHSPHGRVVYALDFKLDDTPTLGEKPNYERLTQLGEEGVELLILDSLYAHLKRRTPSEAVAKEMLNELLLNMDTKNKAVVVTTFSSHIARLKSIVDFGKKLNRKILFLGRSLARYVYAAQDAGLVDFSGDVEFLPYKSKIRKVLNKIKGSRDRYLLVVTGHQGEPNATLSRIAREEFDFRLQRNDIVIFSCTVIPSQLNIDNRKRLERRLRQQKVEIYKDVHQSGHGSQEDHKILIGLLKPKHIVPAHAPPERTEHIFAVTDQLGYSHENVHICEDKTSIIFK